MATLRERHDHGGADAVQQFLAAGLVDEISLHIVPVFCSVPEPPLLTTSRVGDLVVRETFSDQANNFALALSQRVHLRMRLDRAGRLRD